MIKCLESDACESLGKLEENTLISAPANRTEHAGVDASVRASSSKSLTTVAEQLPLFLQVLGQVVGVERDTAQI